MSGWRDLVTNINCWLVTMCYALSQALVQMWQSAMVINFTGVLHLSEEWASTLGIVIGFSSVAASILMATLMDWFRKHMKIAIIVVLSASFLLSVFITLISEKVIVFDGMELQYGDTEPVDPTLTFAVIMYILTIMAVSLACSAAPITFEFAVELCYPVNKGLLGEDSKKVNNQKDSVSLKKLTFCDS